MNPYQQELVAKKIAKDQMFVQFYDKEMNTLRTLRDKAINVAMSIEASKFTDETSVATGKSQRSQTPVDIDTMLVVAEKIYQFYAKDGGLNEIKEPTIQKI